MKEKNEKSKNGKKSMSFKENIEVSPQMAVDKKVYNLRMVKIKHKDEVCKSTTTKSTNTKTSKRSLRRRVKNHSEVSKVVDLGTEDKEVNNNPVIKNDSNKRLPIYRTSEIIEEKVKSGEEVYEFIDDLPASDQKVKKRKKSVRKPAVKRVKQVTTGLQHNPPSKDIKIKATKNVSKNGQLKEKQPIIEAEQSVKHNVCANNKIAKDLQNAGDSTIAEASTVLMDENLRKGEKTSPNNSHISQPNTQDRNMSDHSLIRRSISPITKEVDDLHIESPKRSINGFSQVEKLVQSTPQINRTLGQEKKSVVQKNLNNKSIYSEDTIHLSSIDNKKLTEKIATDEMHVQKENVSPKKFGAVVSNLNSAETEATSIEEQPSIQEKQQSSLKDVMCANSSENNESDQEMQDSIPPISTNLSKEGNRVLNLNQSLKKKIEQTQSSLRFQNLIKQIVPSEAMNNAKNSQKENKNPDFTAGPSNPEKSKAVVLRQSNLNNFLNLDEMPKSTRISTAHGIFDDVNNSPIDGKRPEEIFDESNIENAFGFETYNYSDRSSPIKKRSGPIIATARDVARSVKGKLFVKARVKSSLTRRTPDNMMKKTLLKNIFRKSALVLKAPVNEEIIEESSLQIEKCKNLTNDENQENVSLAEDEYERSTNIMDKREKNRSSIEDQNENNTSFIEVENENTRIVEDESEMISIFTEDEIEVSTRFAEDENKKHKNTAIGESINIPFNPKKAFIDSISFSDTFDFLSENREINESSKEPNEIPMFFDLEPVHFSQPPRRSYSKTKKTVCFRTSRGNCENQSSDEEEEDLKKPKKKRKKISKLNKEEQKKMQQWIKSMNETFHEIEQFNLTVE